jgi:hypothetical protein
MAEKLYWGACKCRAVYTFETVTFTSRQKIVVSFRDRLRRHLADMRKTILLLLGATTLLPACLEEPFLRSDSPTEAGGAVVSLLSQSCDAESTAADVITTLGSGDEVYMSSDDEDEPVLELSMRVKVENHSASEMAIDPRNLRLVGGTTATKPTDSSETRQIPPGESGKVWVRFHKRGGLACNIPMQLTMENAVSVGGRPITLRPLSFIATTSEK